MNTFYSKLARKRKKDEQQKALYYRQARARRSKYRGVRLQQRFIARKEKPTRSGGKRQYMVRVATSGSGGRPQQSMETIHSEPVDYSEFTRSLLCDKDVMEYIFRFSRNRRLYLQQATVKGVPIDVPLITRMESYRVRYEEKKQRKASLKLLA